MGMEYYSFEDVLNVLGLGENELKRLVSEGQIRAFRDKDRMRFRRDDIESMRGDRKTEATIDVPDGAADELHVVESDTEDTLLDLGGLDIDGDFTEDHSSVPSLDFGEPEGGDGLTEELVFDEEPDFALAGKTSSAQLDSLGAEATQRLDEIDDEMDMQTEPLDVLDADEVTLEEDFLDDDEATMVGGDFDATVLDGDLELEDEDDQIDLAPTAPAPKVKRSRRSRGRGRAAPRKAAPAPTPSATEPTGTVSAIWVILLAFIAGLGIISAMVLYDASTDATTPVSEFVGEKVSESFFDEKWRAVGEKVESLVTPEVMRSGVEISADDDDSSD